MAFHHVALAVRDLAETHRFYTETMGFELAKVVVGPTDEGGWAKHVFYDTGGDGLIAFWELHDETLGEFNPAISTALGLPVWVNHLAFRATLDDIGDRRDRWLAHGHDVAEIDHGFCISIYTVDPNGVLVEWCADTRLLDQTDHDDAERLLADPNPSLDDVPIPVFHEARRFVPTA
jgi:catechol 2,3-dioxygenase-like lactoylglutathione lyase family enzyme